MAKKPLAQGSLWHSGDTSGAKQHRVKLVKQRELLRKALLSGRELTEVLASAGWRYDDLVYQLDYLPLSGLPKAPSLGDLVAKSVGIPVASFFTGAGGIDLGLEAAGFQTIAAVEHTDLFCQTLRHNHPAWDVIGPPTDSGDVSDLESLRDRLRRALGRKKRFDGVFVGGPPCQPFSVAANQRFAKTDRNFKRVGFDHAKNGNLLFDYLALVQEFLPRVFVIENVPGLATIDGGAQIGRAISLASRLGYSLAGPMVLDAADHGVPQRRKRFFMVGWTGKGAFAFPKPLGVRFPTWPALAGGASDLPNHVTRQHSAQSVARYMELDYGARDQLGRVDRLDPTLPSKTIIAGGVSGGGRSHLHPTIPRTLSVRECAQLQTFPDSYEFLGPVARQFTQVGNAVPPVLAARIGIQLRELLRS